MRLIGENSKTLAMKLQKGGEQIRVHRKDQRRCHGVEKLVEEDQRFTSRGSGEETKPIGTKR
jgi:hypothetical protein